MYSHRSYHQSTRFINKVAILYPMGSIYYTVRRPKRLKVRRKTAKPKAFKSKESAENWAKENGLKDYELVNLRKEGRRPKIKIKPKY